MNPGQLDRKVILQSMTETRDSLGDVIQTWTTYATPWARRIGSTGKEATENVDQEKNVKPVKWRVRYDDRIGVADRLIYLGTVHDIQDVAEIGREHMMELDTIARDNEPFNLTPDVLWVRISQDVATEAGASSTLIRFEKIADIEGKAAWAYTGGSNDINIEWTGATNEPFNSWVVVLIYLGDSERLLITASASDTESPLLNTDWTFNGAVISAR